MSRSLRVRQDCLEKVKLALRRNGFPSQRLLAERAGFALATVSNFLTGKPVDFATFEELCQRLAIDWQDVAMLDDKPIISPMEERQTAPPQATTLTADTLPCYPNGSIPLGSSFYLERAPIEAQIDRELAKPGALVRIKAPSEMGKTSLLLRVLDRAKCGGARTVSLNLDRVDRAILSDLNQFLRLLCANTARQLQLKPQLDLYWDEDLGSKISCTNYFQEYLLAEIDTHLLLALDEVDRVFEYPEVAKDFLPLLRSWYEEAKTLPVWQKLRIIVVHSTEVYVPLQLNQSPFNVGLPVQLNRFTQQEVQQLARCYGLDWDDGTQSQQLMEKISGHPALVNIALYHLSRGEISLTRLLDTAASPTGIYHDRLQRLWATLAEQPELARALAIVMNATEPIALAPLLAYKLSSLGTIDRVGDLAIPSCELYRQAFGNR
jgi:DNA-binding Xre family transcriptional regulator